MKNAKLLNREPSVEELLQPESNVAKRTEMAIVFYGSDRGNIVHSPAYSFHTGIILKYKL